jgi:hypothetical protein
MIFFYYLCTLNFNDADMAKLVDALDLGSSGQPWGFESLYPHTNQPSARHAGGF